MSADRHAAAAPAAPLSQEIELRAFRYVNGLLEAAAGDAGRRFLALEKTRLLWAMLIADLALPGNGLPVALRGRLIATGLWAQRESQARAADQASLAPLIALHQAMIEALETQVARIRAAASGLAATEA